MKDNKKDARSMTERAKELLDALSGNLGSTAGEHLETLRRETLTDGELEAIASVLAANTAQWHNDYHFNDDYRMRILGWLMGQAGQSPIVRAACATLAKGNAMLAQAAFGETATKGRPEREMIAAAVGAGDARAAFLTWAAAPDTYAYLARQIEAFLGDREAVLANLWSLELASGALKAGAKGGRKMFQAFHALATKNVTESTPASKNLSQAYSRMEVMALNLMLLGKKRKDTVTDNIKKNFLCAAAALTESDAFGALEAWTLRTILWAEFSRKVEGSSKTWDFFKERIKRTLYSRHTVFSDDRKWGILYAAVKGRISFKDAGFLAFDPLDGKEAAKWKMLEPRHKRQLLEHECRNLYLHDLDEPYPDTWEKPMEAVYRLLTEIGEEDQSPMEGCQAAWDYDMANTVNALTQAGYMEIRGDTKGWIYAKGGEKIMYQYFQRYHGEHGEAPGWISNKVGSRSAIHETFNKAAQAGFPDGEKGSICLALMDAVWANAPCLYNETLTWLLISHPELTRTFLDTGEAADIAETLIKCPGTRKDQKEALARYTVGEDEWQRLKEEAERKEHEEKDLEELEELQESARNAVMDVIREDTWKKTSTIRWFREPALKPELARIATQSIREMDLSVYKKIQEYAEIAEAADCGTYLFDELEKILAGR